MAGQAPPSISSIPLGWSEQLHAAPKIALRQKGLLVTVDHAGKMVRVPVVTTFQSGPRRASAGKWHPIGLSALGEVCPGPRPPRRVRGPFPWAARGSVGRTASSEALALCS